MFGGTPGDEFCTGEAITEEDCTAKKGRWGTWCLNESKCVPVHKTVYHKCQINLPKEEIAPYIEHMRSYFHHLEQVNARPPTVPRPRKVYQILEK